MNTHDLGGEIIGAQADLTILLEMWKANQARPLDEKKYNTIKDRIERPYIRQAW
jgi:hypothetical protein